MSSSKKEIFTARCHMCGALNRVTAEVEEKGRMFFFNYDCDNCGAMLEDHVLALEQPSTKVIESEIGKPQGNRTDA